MNRKPIKTFEDLEIYQIAYDLAMRAFEATKDFPKEEKYSLIDQIRRASRSAAVNIAEGWGKRKYVPLFKRHLVDAAGSVQEMKSWLSFSLDCAYLDQDLFKKLWARYDELGAKIFKLHDEWKSFQISDFRHRTSRQEN